VDFFTKKQALLGLFSLPEVFCGPICQKCVGGRGSTPDPAEGAHDAPQTPPRQSTPLSVPLASRFSRLWRSASVPPYKILATPLVYLQPL